MRTRRLLPWPSAARSTGWWLLALLLAGSCLNPQPDPFPQADGSSERQGTELEPPMAAGAPDQAAPLAPAPQPEAAPQLPASTPAEPNAGGAAAPDADDVDASAPDAGADAGGSDGPLVGD